MNESIQPIIDYCESCLDEHGDSYRGVGWTREYDPQMTYQLMLEGLRRKPGERLEILDFGCGLSHFYAHLQERQVTDMHYSGLDLSPKMLQISRQKYPDIAYYQLDVLAEPETLPEFDYIVMNGILTARFGISEEAMWDYSQRLLKVLYGKARKGLVFNCTSSHVDWPRDDLFHLALDPLAAFLKKELSRHYVIRNDYGLFQYMVYLYRQPVTEFSL